MFKREKAAASESIRRENRLETEPVLFLRGEIEKSPLEEPRAFAGLARPPQRFGEEEKLPFFRGVGRAVRRLERVGGGPRRRRKATKSTPHCCRAGRGRAEHARRHDAQRVRRRALPGARSVFASGKSDGTGRDSRQGGPFVPIVAASLLFAGGAESGGKSAPRGIMDAAAFGAAPPVFRIRLSDAAPESVFFPRPSS